MILDYFAIIRIAVNLTHFFTFVIAL